MDPIIYKTDQTFPNNPTVPMEEKDKPQKEKVLRAIGDIFSLQKQPDNYAKKLWNQFSLDQKDKIAHNVMKYIESHKGDMNNLDLSFIADKKVIGGSSQIQNTHRDDLYVDFFVSLYKQMQNEDKEKALTGFTFIEEFNIEPDSAKGQRVRLEIAKIDAHSLQGTISEVIQFYGIKDPPNRIEIAKIAASRNGLDVSKNIENYNITDKSALIEIAKIAAAENGRGVSIYIKNYGIRRETTLAEIAKIAACQNGGAVSEHIREYGIKDPKELASIAKIAVHYDAKDASEFIGNYQISNEADLRQIAKVAIFKSPSSLEHYLNVFPKLSKIHEGLNIGETPKWSLIASEEAASEQDDKIHISTRLNKLLLPQEPLTEESREKVLENLVCLYLLYDNLDERGIKELQKPIEEIYNFRNPQVRKNLLQHLIFEFNENHIAEWSNISKSKGDANYQVVLHLLMSILKIQGISEDNIDALSSSARTLKSGSRTPIYKDAMVQQRCLPFLVYLIEDQTITPNRKGQILRYLSSLTNKEDLTKNLEALIGIRNILFKFQCLSDGELNFDRLKSELERAFEHVIPEIKNYENFSKEFEEIFGKFRSPTAIYSYAGKLQELPTVEREKSLKHFSEFILETLKGQYYEARYLGSPHLDAIFAASPGLKEKWIQGETIPYTREGKATDSPTESSSQIDLNDPTQNKNANWTVVDTDDPCDLLLCGTEVMGSCQNIEGDPVYTKGLVAYLQDGKNRLIAIKDANGKIQARSICRLLISDEGKPVLFLETIYPANISEEKKRTLIEFATSRARSLGLPLYSYQLKEGENCNVKLESKGSRSPYEYVDAAGGIHNDGLWRIEATKELYVPKEV